MDWLHGLRAWDTLRTSFWFLPSLMLAAAAVLSLITLAIDDAVDAPLGSFWWVDISSPEEARALLIMIAGAVLGVAGVTFSITIVTLTLAASQFGNRLLRNFLRDRGNQAALGTFVSTFLYCVLVLPAIDATPGAPGAPQISVAVATLLALVSTVVFVLFIHHVASSIRATNVVSAVASELDTALARLYSDGANGQDRRRAALPEEFDTATATRIPAAESGYIQTVDAPAVVRAAEEANAIVVLLHAAGRFVVEGTTLAHVWPPDRCDDTLAETVQAAFSLGGARTIIQDVEFAIDQIVEIAVRALSPGVSDPFTAMECIDRLGQALALLAERDLPPNAHLGTDDALRLVAPALTFDGVMDAAFNQIRQHSRTDVAVVIRLLETYAAIAERCRTREQIRTVRRHTIMTERGARRAAFDPADADDIGRRFQRTLATLRQGPGAS